ncbi:MAG: hypothetical protein KKE61_05750 [Proteobacteria bacterium]|nr:hypothetical protein [Pseudomonadota bacterium]
MKTDIKSKFLKNYTWISLMIFLFLIARFPYRQFVYSSNIYDFGLANIFPNLFAAILYTLIFSIFMKSWSASIVSFLSLFIHELNQVSSNDILDKILILPMEGTFDIFDIVASAIGCLIAYFMLKKINKKVPLKGRVKKKHTSL